MKTFLDWSAYKDSGMGDAYADIPKTGGDFAKAVAVCINSRQCERETKGVMCPSFRVSQNPNYSTGGRVRLLKSALNGEMGELPFTDPKLAETMDLCLGCKGCKRECENKVDMSLIKMEYLAQRQAKTGISLRSRILANFPIWLHRYPWLKSLPKLRNHSGLLAKLGEKFLKLSARRQVPEPASESFTPPASLLTDKNNTQIKEVVLLIDTFSRHFEPEIPEAALHVLTAAGYQVFFAEPAPNSSEASRPLCCGRTFLAQGLVDEARAEAQRVVDALLPHVEAGRTIIGLEPSCLLSLRDEYLSLGLGDAAVKISQQAFLFEEFLAREHTAKRLNLSLKALSSNKTPALIHGHCHQNALGAMKSMRKILKLIPQFEFEIIEPSCCGMAGSFGIEAEHAALSLDMANQTLLPALQAAPDAQVISNGFSCRHQIRETAQRQPKHLAVLLRESLDLRSDGLLI
jgi:Fe-S oxidoreductase